jgi:CO dehydrogenase maturation factor
VHLSESALLRALVMHIVLQRDRWWSWTWRRASSTWAAPQPSGGPAIVVVEPGRRSIDTAEHIRRLAAEIALRHIAIVGNKIRNAADEAFLKANLDFEFLGFLPQDDRLIEADLRISPYEVEARPRRG